MPIGDLQVPVIGKNVVIASLVQSHILFATFIIGAVLVAATSEYLGMITKQPNYERFARNLARFVVLLFGFDLVARELQLLDRRLVQDHEGRYGPYRRLVDRYAGRAGR